MARDRSRRAPRWSMGRCEDATGHPRHPAVSARHVLPCSTRSTATRTRSCLEHRDRCEPLEPVGAGWEHGRNAVSPSLAGAGVLPGERAIAQQRLDPRPLASPRDVGPEVPPGLVRGGVIGGGRPIRGFFGGTAQPAPRAAGTSTRPTLLLRVILQADGDRWAATAADGYLAGRWLMRGRDRAPEAPGSVGTSRAAVLCAIFSALDEVTSRAPGPRRTAGASRCRAGTQLGRRFAIARGRWRTPGRTRDCAAAPRSVPTCFAPRRAGRPVRGFVGGTQVGRPRSVRGWHGRRSDLDRSGRGQGPPDRCSRERLCRHVDRRQGRRFGRRGDRQRHRTRRRHRGRRILRRDRRGGAGFFGFRWAGKVYDKIVREYKPLPEDKQ